ncbi:hypothetical protein [Micrococcus sp. FDAARGOS_333]|uniref:hypothetical protein n=1 Tax=Micrococcus sp. FDAARGOS_333 TaxID=1930558 RepID=UPI000B4E3EDF|nr:hypothetical protein [Micrococcus sp. FDAARGOS_333]PNL18412.1 hypothetical protein CEQ11_010285 [Micrococcus sp. FDAARGOS_333]
MARRIVSLLLAVLAGLAGVLAVVGAAVDQAIRAPELTHTAVDRVMEDPDVEDAAPRFVLDLVEAALPREISLVAGDLIREVTDHSTGAALQDERVRAGVLESAEQARADWADRLDAGEVQSDSGSGDDSEAGTLTVPLGPVVSHVGVGLVDDLADGTADLLGNDDGSLVVPGGSMFGVEMPETDLAVLFDRARDGIREFAGQDRLSVLVHVGGDDALVSISSSLADAPALMRASAHWVWAAVAAAVLGLAAVILGPGRWRGVAIAVVGLLLVGGALAIPEAVASPDLVRLSVPEDAPRSLADLTEAVDGVVRSAVADSFGPSTTGLLYGGGAAVVVGLLWAALAERRRRS